MENKNILKQRGESTNDYRDLIQRCGRIPIRLCIRINLAERSWCVALLMSQISENALFRSHFLIKLRDNSV